MNKQLNCQWNIIAQRVPKNNLSVFSHNISSASKKHYNTSTSSTPKKSILFFFVFLACTCYKYFEQSICSAILHKWTK